MCQGPSINNTMDLYKTANYTKKMQDLNDFYTVALFSAIRIDIYVKINSLRLISKQ